MLKIQKQVSLALTALVAMQMLVVPVSMAQHSNEHSVKLQEVVLFEEKAANRSVLRPYDQSPLEDRIPLVLVHGIGGTDTRLFHWDKFLEYTDAHPEFNKRYKIYLFSYDSSRSVPVLSDDLKQTLKGFIQSLDGRTIRVLGYSEGGLLVRNAMQDPYVYQHTDRVMTIATPFHGSPLANPEWLKEQVAGESPLSLVRMTHKLVYDITGRKYPTFKEDFHWDNFDGAIPAEEFARNNGPQVRVNYALDDKKQFITYGSYFGVSGEAHDDLPKLLGVEKPLPREQAKMSHLFKKNLLFSVIRKNIAKLPLAWHKDDKQPEIASTEMENTHLLAVADVPDAMQSSAHLQGNAALADEPSSIMAYNDGISPISSTLWLGRFTPNFKWVSNPTQRMWMALKSLRGNKNTRLFAGLDHRNWMDGTTRTEQKAVMDLLNPEEKPKTVFEWIVYDLMG